MMTHARFMRLHKSFPFPVTCDVGDGSCWKTKYAGLKFCGDKEDDSLLVLLYNPPSEVVVEANGAVDIFVAINIGRDL